MPDSDAEPVDTAADLRYEAVPAQAERLPALRRALAGWAERLGMGTDDMEALTLAVYEALANVVAHAYPDGQGTLDLHAIHAPAVRRIEVTVTDRGQWRPPPAVPGMLHGRGLPLMHRLSEAAEVTPGPTGTVVTLTWRTP